MFNIFRLSPPKSVFLSFRTPVCLSWSSSFSAPLLRTLFRRIFLATADALITFFRLPPPLFIAPVGAKEDAPRLAFSFSVFDRFPSHFFSSLLFLSLRYVERILAHCLSAARDFSRLTFLARFVLYAFWFFVARVKCKGGTDCLKRAVYFVLPGYLGLRTECLSLRVPTAAP